MSAQASDIQQVLSKTQAVERMYQAQKQQPDNEQQQFAATIQQKMQEKARQAQETSETDKSKIQKDKQDKLSLSYKKKKKKKTQQQAEEKLEDDKTLNDDPVGQIVDIKI